MLERSDPENLNILIVGHTSLDDICGVDGSISKQTTGGAALYALLGATLWPGVTVGLVTRVGDDFPDTRLHVASYNPRETNWDGVKRCQGPSIRDTIHHHPDGSRLVTFYDESRLDILTPDAGDVPASLSGAQYVHLAPGDLKIQVQLAAQAKAAGSKVALDTETHYLGGDGRLLQELLELVDVFMPSIEQTPYLVGSVSPGSDRWAQRVMDLGPAVVVIKCGAMGSAVFERDSGQCWHVPPPSGLSVVDVTGAGDAFCGGFLAGLVRTGHVVQAAAHGTVSASVILESLGAARNEPQDASLLQRRLEATSNAATPEPGEYKWLLN